MKDVERISKVLTMNGINNGDVLTGLEQRGYGSDACQALAEEIVEDIRQIVVHAVNHRGFDNNEQDVISVLLKILSKLDDVKIVKKLPDLKKRRESEVASLHLNVAATDVDVKALVLTWINNALAGKDLLTTGGIIADDLLAQVKKSFKLLEEIKSVVADVWDAVSKAAADIASEIVNEFREWRNSLSLYICTEADVAHLEEALEKAKEWKAIYTIAEKKNELATEEYVKQKGLIFVNDAYASITQVKAAKDNIAAFKSRLTAYERETEQLTRLGALKSEKESLLKEQEEQDLTVKSVMARYKNGEISAETAAATVKDCDAKTARIKKRLAEVNRDIQKGERIADGRQATSRALHKVVDKINAFEMDPVKFKWLCSKVDFKQVLAVLGGRSNNEQIQKVANDLFEALVRIEKMLEASIVDPIVGVGDDVAEALHLTDDFTIEEKTGQEQSAEDFLKERFAQLEGGDPPTGGETEDVGIKNDITKLTDDDR